VQYAPFIGDEKRDYVEYTSEAFLSQLHTMVTYTRCADSVLCAPLYVDVCCLLDYFARKETSPAIVAEATSYLFKVPEGRSGPVVGFSEQLRALENALDGQEVEAHEVVDVGPRILCCGLACLDVELGGAQDGPREAINAFGEASSRAGGAAPQTASCLSDHGIATVVVVALGDDAQGDELRTLLEDRGCHVDETLGKGRTGLAIVPVFVDGRGCYFAAGANAEFNADQLVQGVERAVKAGPVSAVLVGYPHLLPALQEGLGEAFDTIRGKTDALIGVDLNGVQAHHYLGDGVVDAALYKADVVHANADEAATLLRWPLRTYGAAQLARGLCDATGAACVLVTDGANGAAAALSADTRLAASKLPEGWPAGGVSVVAATPGPPGSAPNANGAGDAFFAAFCATTALHNVSLDEALAVASAVAGARVFDLPRRPLEEVVAAIRGGSLVS
jgi:sugar/nucleoside kinase (ribokinase family)